MLEDYRPCTNRSSHSGTAPARPPGQRTLPARHCCTSGATGLAMTGFAANLRRANRRRSTGYATATARARPRQPPHCVDGPEQFQLIGSTTSTVYSLRPAKLIKRIHTRATRTCPCGKTIGSAPRPRVSAGRSTMRVSSHSSLPARAATRCPSPDGQSNCGDKVCQRGGPPSRRPLPAGTSRGGAHATDRGPTRR